MDPHEIAAEKILGWAIHREVKHYADLAFIALAAQSNAGPLLHLDGATLRDTLDAKLATMRQIPKLRPRPRPHRGPAIRRGRGRRQAPSRAGTCGGQRRLVSNPSYRRPRSTREQRERRDARTSTNDGSRRRLHHRGRQTLQTSLTSLGAAPIVASGAA